MAIKSPMVTVRLIPKGNAMSALFRSSLKARLLAAVFACCFAIGTLTTAGAGPLHAQADAPNLGASRTTEAPSFAPGQNATQSANIGNPAPVTGPEKRVALVIGNSAYEHVSALPNPANDAKAIGQFLNSAGFEVIQATDLDHDEMVQVLQDFSARLAGHGPNTVAFVYYAGHGLQIAGDNYLVPIDARISSEADVPNAAVRLVDVMATLQAVPSRMRAVVLDACRNNPFSSLKDTGRGLAIVDAPNGSIVAYSTAPGTEAFDGEGSNSPYTSAFLRLASEPNLPIEQFFKKVRVAVNDATDGKQTPWESSSLTSDFYFFGDTAVAAAKIVEPVQSAKASANRPVQVAQNLRTRTPREAYNMAIAEGSTEYYQEFVRIYPYDPFADHIRRLLAARLLAAAWHGAVLANSPVVYKEFYSKYADSPYATVAMKLAVQPKAMPLYQPTKVMVAPQIAPKVKLTNFNGVNIGQGNNAPIGLGGNGSLFNKKLGPKLGLGSQGAGNQGARQGPGIGQKLGLPGNTSGQNKPGIDLAKGAKRLDAKIEGGRLTTLPRDKQRIGRVHKDVKVLDGKAGNGNTGLGHRIRTRTGDKQVLGNSTNDRPLIKRIDRPRTTKLPAHQMTTTQSPIPKRFQPQRRLFNDNGGNGGGGSGSQLRTTKPMTFGGGNSGGGRLAGGGMGLGRSFR